MSAECDKCGADLVYGDEWPKMFCERCQLRDEVERLREERDRAVQQLETWKRHGYVSGLESQLQALKEAARNVLPKVTGSNDGPMMRLQALLSSLPQGGSVKDHTTMSRMELMQEVERLRKIAKQEADVYRRTVEENEKLQRRLRQAEQLLGDWPDEEEA